MALIAGSKKNAAGKNNCPEWDIADVKTSSSSMPGNRVTCRRVWQELYWNSAFMTTSLHGATLRTVRRGASVKVKELLDATGLGPFPNVLPENSRVE